MFACSKCGSVYQLPKCIFCGNKVACTEDIWQLTDDPDIVTSGDGDKYIGYEYIGESYSGNRKYVLEYKDGLFAKEISRLTGDGVFLDLGCGDGCFTVPVAQFGTKVIAADISNTMLKILRDKAEYNNVSLENVILCRMNALHILLADNSVDCVVSNSVLHLISRPEHVINEIYRVLKPNGCFVFKDDRPGIEKEMPYDNTLYNNIVNDIYSTYWKILKQKNVYPQKYSWKFDRKSICEKTFQEKEEIVLPVQMEFSNKIEDGFLPRWMSRGFSDQVDVPIDLHIIAISQTIKDIKKNTVMILVKLRFRVQSQTLL